MIDYRRTVVMVSFIALATVMTPLVAGAGDLQPGTSINAPSSSTGDISFLKQHGATQQGASDFDHATKWNFDGHVITVPPQKGYNSFDHNAVMAEVNAVLNAKGAGGGQKDSGHGADNDRNQSSLQHPRPIGPCLPKLPHDAAAEATKGSQVTQGTEKPQGVSTSGTSATRDTLSGSASKDLLAGEGSPDATAEDGSGRLPFCR
jgi:hypothetical protein